MKLNILKNKSGHELGIVGAPMKAVNLGTPKGQALVPDSIMKDDPSRTVVQCWDCRTPLYYVPARKKLGKMSFEQPPPVSLGNWNVPKKGFQACPVCKTATFAHYNGQRWQYRTSKGII